MLRKLEAGLVKFVNWAGRNLDKPSEEDEEQKAWRVYQANRPE